MTGTDGQDPIFASDHSYAANQIPPMRRFRTVAPATFRVFGTPLIAGRDETWTDIAIGSPRSDAGFQNQVRPPNRLRCPSKWTSAARGPRLVQSTPQKPARASTALDRPLLRV